MVETYAIAIVVARCLSLPQAEGHDAAPAQVHDSLTLAHDLAGARVSKRAEQLAVELQTAIEGRNDEVEMIDARSSHEPQSRPVPETVSLGKLEERPRGRSPHATNTTITARSRQP